MATVLKAQNDRRSAGRPSGQATLRIGIDATQLVFGVSGGVEVYFRTLVRALMSEGDASSEEWRTSCRERRGGRSPQAAEPRVAPVLIARDDQERALRETFGSDLLIRLLPTVYAPLPVRAARWLRRRLGPPRVTLTPPAPSVSFREIERELGLDVLHSPVQLFADLDFRSPGVLNLHDLQHVHFPENFTPAEREMRDRLYGRSAHAAAAVVASSEFVRNDIVRRLGVPHEKVRTIPVACDPEVIAGAEQFTKEEARSRYRLPDTFAFYPAAFWPHKNHVRLIEAVAIARSRSPRHDLKLVCSGCRKHAGYAAVERALDRFGMRDHVRFLDVIPTGRLGGVYRASAFCVVPSLFEASSYPVIEAQTLGVPAMCSAVTSLPELMAGGSGLLFDPLSAEDVAEKMLRWLNDPADRQEHAERGRRRAVHDHGLETYAARMRELYASIIGRDRDV